MAWERRGNHSYYYRKERDGKQVRSVYVGRGEIAHMISNIQSSSPFLETLARRIKSPEILRLERVEMALDQVSDLTRLLTQAALLAAGFHTHKRQWRRMRNGK
jgi:hypothetical protein